MSRQTKTRPWVSACSNSKEQEKARKEALKQAEREMNRQRNAGCVQNCSPMYSRHTLVITWRNLARDFHTDVSEWSMDDLRERILELKRAGARIPSGT